MKNMRWYYKMLLSYLPVFFFSISFLFLLFFLAMFEWSQSEARRSSLGSVEQAIQTIDQTLQTVDQFVIKEMLTNESFDAYFAPNAAEDAWVEYQASRELNDFLALVPWIDSMYLYRVSDDVVLTESSKISLADFGDRRFVESLRNESVAPGWTGYRLFRKFEGEVASERVVSLVKRVPLDSGGAGFVVTNVSVISLQRMVDKTVDLGVSYIRIADKDGMLLAASDVREAEERDDSLDSEGAIVRSSSYTGWKIYSGMRRASVFRIMSTLEHGWLWLGVLVSILAVAWIAYVTRRHSRPIEEIVRSINTSVSERDGTTFKENEIEYIQKSVAHLLDMSRSYQKESEAHASLRSRQIFLEYIQGRTLITPNQWKEQLDRLSLFADPCSYLVSVFEIDGYSQFVDMYSARDQALLKLVLHSVLLESAEGRVRIAAEWIEPHRLCVLALCDEIEGADGIRLLETVREWVEQHLPYTVTIGAGLAVDGPADIPISFRASVDSLDYKTVLGRNRVIRNGEQGTGAQVEILKHLSFVRQLATDYRLGEEAWSANLRRMFQSMRQEKASKDQIVQTLTFLNYHLHREMLESSETVQSIWNEELHLQLGDCLIALDTLDAIENEYFALLHRASERIRVVRQSRVGHTLVREIRDYIESELGDPDLSLVLLADKFQLHATYLSKLFKEEIGERFTDYVTRIRLERSIELLQTTDLPIQEVGMQVGYLHSISFIRVFKKTFGCTPGEYRKTMRG